jgi:hypothetical protein
VSALVVTPAMASIGELNFSAARVAGTFDIVRLVENTVADPESVEVEW